MKALHYILALCLVACAPTIVVDGSKKRAYINAGILSTVQGFSGDVKLGPGIEATFSVVGADAATGPVQLAGLVTTWKTAENAANNATATVRSNNHTSNVNTALTQKPTVLTSKGADGLTTESAVFNPALTQRPH